MRRRYRRGRCNEASTPTYLTPLCDHATMEPLNGTALVTANRVDLWHPAAMVVQALVIATEETGVPARTSIFTRHWSVAASAAASTATTCAWSWPSPGSFPGRRST